MTEKFEFDLIRNKVPEYSGDISILLIDHDIASVASLTSMLEQFSYKVMSVNEASKAIPTIKKQKDIALVIANTEMPHIDTDFFHTLLVTKDIPFILISPDVKTEQSSNCLKKRAGYILQKPISEKDIKNMLQHVLYQKSPKLENTSTTKNKGGVREEHIKQIEAFRETIKRQRTNQASLLGKRPFMKTFSAPETYQNRRNIANDEWKSIPVYPIGIENKKQEGKKMESNVGRHKSLWTLERHMKFLSAISILGDKDSYPTSILRIMNDPSLTNRQVASHLQKYKAQVDRLNNKSSRSEWRSTNATFENPSDYKYPFKASNQANNLISAKNIIKERDTGMIKFHLGGKLDLSNHPFFGNVSNKSSMEVDCVPAATSTIPPYNISPTNDVYHTNLVSTSFASNNLLVPSGLASSVGVSNTSAFHMGYIPQYSPNQFQSPSSILETSMNQMAWNSSTESCVLAETNMNRIFPETITNQMGRVSSGERYVPSGNMILSTVQEDFIHRATTYASLNSVIPPRTTMNLPQTNISHTGNTSFGESSVLPQEMISYETNTTRVSLVSRELNHGTYSQTSVTILETNINQRNWISSGESYVLPENMVSSEANMTQADLVPCETTYPALGSVVPPETNMEDISQVQYDDGDVPIEDLISFDDDVNEMDINSLLENYGCPERNTPSNMNIGHEAYNTPMEREDQIHSDNSEFMDWINNVLIEDI